MTSEAERWHIGGRYYGVTIASAPTSMDLELDDLGPGVDRGTVGTASMSDNTSEISLRVFTNRKLPIQFLEQFAAEARRRL